MFKIIGSPELWILFKIYPLYIRPNVCYSVYFVGCSVHLYFFLCLVSWVIFNHGSPKLYVLITLLGSLFSSKTFSCCKQGLRMNYKHCFMNTLCSLYISQSKTLNEEKKLHLTTMQMMLSIGSSKMLLLQRV